MRLAMSLMIAELHGQDFLYTTNNGAITITGSTATNGLVGQVSIPSTIAQWTNYPRRFYRIRSF